MWELQLASNAMSICLAIKRGVHGLLEILKLHTTTSYTILKHQKSKTDYMVDTIGIIVLLGLKSFLISQWNLEMNQLKLNYHWRY